MTGLLLAVCLSADPRITVTVLPGLDVRSKLFAADLQREWSEWTPYARRMKRLRAEIAEIADVKVLDPLTPSGGAERPAVRVGRGKWQPVGDLSKWDRGGGVTWLRSQLNPWIVDREMERRIAAYEAECERRREANWRITVAFHDAHRDGLYLNLGDHSSRVVFDERSRCWCRLVPLSVETARMPEPPALFDPDEPYPALEAPKPCLWASLVPELVPVEAGR